METFSYFNYSMDSYNHFKAEEFLENPSFRAWVYGKSSPAETDYWKRFLGEYPQAEEAILEAKSVLLSLVEPEVIMSEEYIRQRSRRILEQTSSSGVKRSFWRWGGSMAAILVLTAGLGGWLIWKNQAISPPLSMPQAKAVVKEHWNEIINESQQSRLVLLPDGSSAVLQSQSRIAFPKKFDAAKREVVLMGEAFFEVKKNSKQPFFVETNEVITRVTGTSFTIRAFESAKQVKVTVKTGTVAVFKKAQQEVSPQVVRPNQQATFERQNQTLSISESPLPELTVLEKEPFTFTRTPISEVFRILEKNYGVKINYDSELMRHCTLSAELGDKPVLEKLTLICAGIESTYEYQDGKITIHSKGCH
ncbi:FecR family protein [Siphonobacter curvatus]|uniref:Iron dicitrate transport regulator FecR n=1 Tax=Siphonobacter curvatus TaxID=2094562 RepID=A0A2S7IFS9_9BACT|nr:FecR family protein [Siphonobacter curvatus]PQA54075.1 iron dicitrate transport regulator FecR [Siphonobacter curvatus]